MFVHDLHMLCPGCLSICVGDSSQHSENVENLGLCLSVIQSLEFVAETSILTEVKIENRGKIFFKQSVGVAESMEITP